VAVATAENAPANEKQRIERTHHSVELHTHSIGDAEITQAAHTIYTALHTAWSLLYAAACIKIKDNQIPDMFIS